MFRHRSKCIFFLLFAQVFPCMQVQWFSTLNSPWTRGQSLRIFYEFFLSYRMWRLTRHPVCVNWNSSKIYRFYFSLAFALLPRSAGAPADGCERFKWKAANSIFLYQRLVSPFLICLGVFCAVFFFLCKSQGIQHFKKDLLLCVKMSGFFLVISKTCLIS